MSKAPPSAIGDAELLAACRQGAVWAERGLYERYGPLLLSICRCYAADAMEAEDFHQLAWIRAFERLSGFREEGSLEGWLRRLCVNTCLAQLRARRRRTRWQQPLDEQDAEAPAAWAELDFLAEERLLELIAALPEGARLVFNLYAVEGYDHGQIAAALAISETNSRQQLLRARRLLALRLPDFIPTSPKPRL